MDQVQDKDYHNGVGDFSPEYWILDTGSLLKAEEKTFLLYSYKTLRELRGSCVDLKAFSGLVQSAFAGFAEPLD